MDILLTELANKVKDTYRQKEQGRADPEHVGTFERLSGWRVKDMGTHLKRFSQALGRESPGNVYASELTDENLERAGEFMKEEGCKEDVIRNTTSNLRFLRDYALELGVQVMVLPKLDRPKKHQVFSRPNSGRVVIKLAPKSPFGFYTPYALRYDRWPKHLKEEAQPIIQYYTDRFAEHRNVKLYRKDTMTTWLNGMGRFFGFLIQQGVPLEALSFDMTRQIEWVKRFRMFLFERKQADTEGTRGELERLRHLMAGYYQDAESASEISLLMTRCEFVTLKDKNELVKRIHADDLYKVARALCAEAQHYEANLHRKYGRAFPQAQAAAHWMKAAMWAFTISTMLRERNVTEATTYHIYKDGANWHFRFKSGEMKGPRAKGDQVVDLWEGDNFQSMLDYLLDKVVEVRPQLIHKFRALNPGKPDPEAFFLNEDGKPFKRSAMRGFFYSASVRYLGPEKQIAPHDVRTVGSSWLVVREGPEFATTIQRYLDHCSIRTTETYYVKVEGIFNAQMAKLKVEENRKKRELDRKLHALPAELTSMFGQIIERLDLARLDSEELEGMIKSVIRTEIENYCKQA